jgi:hypothetical protein
MSPHEHQIARLLFTSLLLARRELSALCQIRARTPWQTGNLPLAQAKHRFYRSKQQPLGNLANCLSSPNMTAPRALTMRHSKCAPPYL